MALPTTVLPSIQFSSVQFSSVQFNTLFMFNIRFSEVVELLEEVEFSIHTETVLWRWRTSANV